MPFSFLSDRVSHPPTIRRSNDEHLHSQAILIFSGVWGNSLLFVQSGPLYSNRLGTWRIRIKFESASAWVLKFNQKTSWGIRPLDDWVLYAESAAWITQLDGTKKMKHSFFRIRTDYNKPNSFRTLYQKATFGTTSGQDTNSCRRIIAQVPQYCFLIHAYCRTLPISPFIRKIRAKCEDRLAKNIDETAVNGFH